MDFRRMSYLLCLLINFKDQLDLHSSGVCGGGRWLNIPQPEQSATPLDTQHSYGPGIATDYC